MTEQPPFRPPSAYLHGGPVPVTVVPARVASWLERHANLSQIRIENRGNDSEVDNVLVALRASALAWRDSATGRKEAAEPEELTPWVSTTEASDILDITDRAIRLAIQEQRLKARRINGRWRIAREDIEHYKAARKAA